MGLFKRRAAEPVTPEVDDVLLRAFLNGEEIDRAKAMTIPAVSGCVDYIANAVASMPVKLYRYRDGKIVEETEDTRVKLLNGDTGDTLTAFEMKKAMTADYLMAPLGGYIYIDRDVGGDVVGLHYVDNIWIALERNFQPIFKDYNVIVDGRRYYPWDFIRLLRNTQDGSCGKPLTVEVGKALQAAYETILYQVQALLTGGNKKGFLKSEKTLTQEAIDKLKEAWRRLYSNNSENVVVLNNGIDFKEASATAMEMQLNESKNTLADEIRSIFHIYLNDENRTFKEAIYPIVKAFETELNSALLNERERKKMFFELDVKEIVRANLTERYSAYKMAKETGFMTLNEIRRAENMEEVDGLDVVNVGLGAVLYDTEKHVYYTPNTDTIGNMGDADVNIQKLIEDKELDTAFEESGNSAEA
jgi:HK97 family phage portal protein